MNTKIDTMFCLVSRQAMANVLPVLMFIPETVYLLATPEEKNCADNLETLFKSKKIKVKRKNGLNAYDYVSFKMFIKQELETFTRNTWLNVTGGTKLMALAAYEAFAEKKKNIIYCDTENNQIIHLYPKLFTELLKLNLTISDYLKSYGYKIVNNKPQITDLPYLELFELLESNKIITKFCRFLDNYRSLKSISNRSKTFFDKRDRLFYIQKTNVGEYIISVKNEKFKFNNDLFFRGEWLEYFMLYSLIKQNINPEVGIKILSSSNVENEIDLVFIKNYQLHLISCKSGKQSNPNKDIYEIETLRNIAGGTFGKGFLVTTRDLSQGIQKRAEELGIKILVVDKLTHTEFL